MLVVVVEYGELPEMLRVADVVKSRLGRDVTVFFAKRGYRDLARDSALVAARGHSWLDPSGARVPAPVADSSQESVRAGTRARPGWLRALAGDVRALLRDLLEFRARFRQITSILRRAQPKLVVVGQDLVGKELSFALIAARRLGIPTLIVPFAMFSVRELVTYAAGRPELQMRGRPFNAIVAKRYPRWVYRHEGRELLRLQGSRALALEWSGLAGGNPWAPCSEPANAVAVESGVALRNFLSMGIPRECLRVVGAPVFDRLAAALHAGRGGRDELMRRHGLDPARPLLVCGWPANIFAWLGERRIEYPDYPSLAQAWGRLLADVRDRYGMEVLVSVHPKTLDAEWEAARQHKLACQRGKTEETIAHCDAFVTLNGSSITAWAIACRKAVLLFDCYRTGYEDFDSAPGCVMVHDEAAFAAELGRLCADPGRRHALSQAQAAVAADWGELDGRSSERLAALCRELIDAAVPA